MDTPSRNEGSFHELAADLLTDAYPDADQADLQQEATEASAELSKLDEISSELERIASFAPPPRQDSRERAAGRAGGDIDLQVPLAQEGNHEAITKLLARIHPLVVRYCRARLGRTFVAGINPDDVAQEVCLSVLTELPGYRVSSRPFLAFVYGVASKKVIEAYRRRERALAQDVAEHPSDTTAQEPILFRYEPQSNLVEALDQLTEKQREVIIMRIVMGLSVEETAEAVGMPSGAVRVVQHRALIQMRRVLALDESSTDSEEGGISD